jgi:alpha-glucosidase (family GH31 glycosyl hydrolase)/beta-glucosidase/6-phospho-beta-glucosidase/beta-galactosidase
MSIINQFLRKMKAHISFIFVLSIVIGLVGCENSDNVPPKPVELSGMALTGKPIEGKIFIKDKNGKLASCEIASDGSFVADVIELTPPFVLWSEPDDSAPNYYSMQKSSGYVNVNPATNAIMAMAIKQNPSEYYSSGNNDIPDDQDIESGKETIVEIARSYGIPLSENFDPMTDVIEPDKKGFDRILELTDMEVDEAGNLTITDHETGIMIYKDNVTDTLQPELIPEETFENVVKNSTTPTNFTFPENFIWGTATAAHQVESDNTNNDWYAWEELNRIKDDHSNLTGPDHWNNYEKDFDIAKYQLGTNAYRMSIEWSKIEPSPDQYDQEVINHYHAMLDALIERNIKPVVSLQHFSLPLWIHDPTPDPNNDNQPTNPGWNDDTATPYIVERIVKFTEDMAKEFGAKVDWWITINEPLVMYANGYLVGDFPPGVGYKNEAGALNLPFPMGHHDTIKENLLDAYKTEAYGLKAGIQASKVIFPNIIRAHVLMYDAIKANDTVDADGDSKSSMVSISKHHVVFRPIGTDSVSLTAYSQMNFLWNEMIWDAIIKGQLDSDLNQEYDEDLTLSYGTFPKVDYIGFNYYARRDVVPVEQISMMMGIDAQEFDFFKGFPVDTSATGALNELLMGNNYNCLGWEIYPQGMEDIIIFYSEKYGKTNNLPIMITENGTDNDIDRPGFVVDMIEKMGDAMKNGHNVIGYLHWSLMDNFEWERGYGQHFGLVKVDFDYETKQTNRELTEGGKAYANIIMNHGVVKVIKDKYGTIDQPANILNDQSICSSGEGGDVSEGPTENWETTLDTSKGVVEWSIVKANDGSVKASGEGSYYMQAAGMDVTVSFLFEQVAANVSGASVSFIASGTALIKEMPSMTSGFIYEFDSGQGTYKITVDSPTWIGLLDSHPIVGVSASTLVSGSGVTESGSSDSKLWKSILDSDTNTVNWEVLSTTDEGVATISGEGSYFINVMGGQYVIFPFEETTATFTENAMSFIATGTAYLRDMPTMTSGYSFELNGAENSYKISVDDTNWQGLLPQHPITGSANISQIVEPPAPTQKGDDSPLTMKNLNNLNVLFKKNGTFSVYNGMTAVLKSKGDSASNGGVLWRNAQIETKLPLAGTVQGGFLGHENFTVQGTDEAPWVSGIQTVKVEELANNSIALTLNDANNSGSALMTVQPYEGDANVIKVTLKVPDDANHVSCSFASDSDERFYGFGSPTWTTQHRGSSIPIWVTEQLLGRVTDEDPSNFMELKGHPYDNQIPIPFFMSSNGYGILLDTTYRSMFEMCTDDHPDTWRIETWNNETSFYIFTGENFTDLLKTYTDISGRPDMPPDWFFGPMNDAVRGEANVQRVANLIRDNNIPSTVIWTEDWLGIGSQATGFRLSHDWDASDLEYPNLASMIDTLHNDGFKFLGYFSPFIPNPETTPGHNVEKWQAANDNTYFFLNPEGTMREMLVPPLIPPAGGGLDLTKSEAVNWYKNYVRQAAQIGLDGAMVDFGEWVPFDSVFADGRTAPEVHNEYPLLWQKANREVWDSLVSDGIKDDYLFYVRSGYAGSQKYAPAFWAGDQNTNWDRLDGMASVITMGLNLGLSGISYFGHDIGGYSSFDTPQVHDLPATLAAQLPANLQSELWDGVSSKELFLRWAAIGAYSPMMRTHHGSRYGQNWSFEGGPNPENFTITNDTVTAMRALFAQETFRAIFSDDALTALANVESAIMGLQDHSFGTWVDIDTEIRNTVADADIEILANANLNIGKLTLRYAQQNTQNLSHPKYDAETINIWKQYAQQHIALFPYLKVYAKESKDYGLPMMRHMILLYPDDPVIQNGIPDNEDFQQFSGEQSKKRPYNELFQYFLGNELLVAPIIDPGATSRPVYLPRGTWYNIFTKEQFDGEKTIIASANIDEIPIFASAGSIVPRLPDGIETLVDTVNADITDYNDKKDVLRITVYSGKDGSFTMVDGTHIQYTHSGEIDNLTTAKVNGDSVNVNHIDKAISIETPGAIDISLELSNGSTLQVSNAPFARTYQICIVAPKPIFAFPDNFIWGTATAAHQVESDNTNNDWYAWEELNRIKDDHSNLTGPDHWNNYEKDFDIAKYDLGTNAYRMSIEWSKIEPLPDQYDQEVINHYHAMLDALIERNIKPVVSLQHFSLPLWIHDPTPEPVNNNQPTNPGWNDDSNTPYIVERIVQFTEDMAKEFGSKVDWWITINEPLVMYANGYLVGDFPPGVGYKNEAGALNLPFPMGHHDTIKENLLDAYKTEAYGLKAGIQASKVIFPNIIHAHIRMYEAIKAYDTIDADGDSKPSMVSISKHHVVFRPLGIDEISLAAYNQMQFLWNEMIWDAIILGQLDSDLDSEYDENLSQKYGTFPKVDYIGFNYYARRDVVPVQQMSFMMGIPVSEFDFFKGFPVDTSATGAMSELLLGNNYNCLGWEIYPQGMKDIIAFYSERYGKEFSLPIMVTENGTDNDADRPGFVVDMIELMGEAMQEGHNVIGYLHWSLMDNFEWERGYGQHFGLVRVDFDYENKQENRSVTEGGEAFASIIKNSGILPSLKDKFGTFYKPTNIRDDQEICAENQGETNDDGKTKEIWETLLDSTKGSVSWSITKEDDGSIVASGEGLYGIVAMGNNVNVSFPFENVQAVIADASVLYTATGAAVIKELPSMTSGFTYIFDGIQQKYTIYVENTGWQDLLDAHPIEGQAVSTLISGSGITSKTESTKWQAALDTNKGVANWEIIDTDNNLVSGEGAYYMEAMGQNVTVSFPFKNISATLTDAGMSFTASGTAVIKEMPTMTSAYTFKLDAESGTYEISVEDSGWQNLLEQHPIVGSAQISPVEDDPGPTVQKGDSSPLTSIQISGLNILFRKNATFSLYKGADQILGSQGDPTLNGGMMWRNAQITPSLPLAGTVQGGFLGHENFSVESSDDAPWQSAIKAIDMTKTEKGIQLTVSEAQEISKGVLIVEEQNIEGINTPVMKVTIKGPKNANHVSCFFASDSDERFYGFGSPTWTTQHRGNSIPIWVTEQLLGRVTDEDPSNFMELKGHPYDNQIPIPFFMSSNGYGILLDTTYRSLFEMCTEDHPDSWRIETWHNETRFYIFTGENFTDLLKTYTAISGRPDMPPDWFFGPMNDAVRGETNVLRVANLIRDNNIPSTVIWTEDWLGIGSQATGFRLSHDWDASDVEYPNLASMIDTLHNDGFKFLGYFSPFIPNPETTPGHNVEKWQAANDNTYFFLNPEGTMREMLVPPLIPPAGGGLDLTKSDAVNWYKNYVRQAAQIGLDGAMVDFGEWVPFDSVFADGRTAPEVHNEYPLLWQKANKEVWDSLVNDGIKDDYLFYVRSGYAGSQKYAPAFWAGDQNTNWDRLDGMASVITMGLNLGLSGVSYFGHDIGGYSSFDTPLVHDLPAYLASILPANLQSELWDGVSSKELFLRWAAIGAYSPMMRTHHGSRYGQNWSFEGGPNPDNFTITNITIGFINNLITEGKFSGILSETAQTALANVQSALVDLQGQSYGTWLDIDSAIRNAVGNADIDTLINANLNIAKLILRYSTPNTENLSHPQYDDETLTTWKKFAQQHMALFPYLKAYAKESVTSGLPIMRHMILLYPDDDVIQNGIPDNDVFRKFSGKESGKRPYNELFQYFLGNEILVAPVIDPDKTSRPVYLPEGTWYNCQTREKIIGPQTIIAEAALDEIPLFSPAGSIVPRIDSSVETLVNSDRPETIDINDTNMLHVEVFSGKNGTFTMTDGTSFEYIHYGDMDKNTTATVNDIDVTIQPIDNAYVINAQSVNIELILSNDSRLLITNSPVQRNYIITIVSPSIQAPKNHKPIYDHYGREIILRGVNARINGVFDVSFDDDREPLEPIPAFSSDDTEAMQKIGFNFLRLPINWSAIEPTPNTYSTDYLDAIQNVVNLCQQAGIYVLLDMHQDAFSKEIGEDGAPLWAIIPDPESVNEGGHLGDLLSLRLSGQVQKAFMSFWNNAVVEVSAKKLQEHFIDAMCHVMDQFKDHPSVLGMEVFNEPWLLHTDMGESDIDKLHQFYTNAFTRLKQTAPEKLVFFEPDVSKNYPSADGRPQYSAMIPEIIPWNTDQTVYAPHLYIESFIATGNPDPNDPEILASINNSLIEAAAFNTPLMIGEFGFNHQDPDYGATMDVVMNLADQYLFHTAQWVWKENSQDAWGFYDFESDVPVLRDTIAKETARAYPQAISGRIQNIRFDKVSENLTVHFTYTDTGEPHIIFIPVTYAYTNGFDVLCDGENVSSTQLDNLGRIAVSCGANDGNNHVLQVSAKSSEVRIAKMNHRQCSY